MSIKENIDLVNENIERALERVGRTDKVELITVTKTVDEERMKEAILAGSYRLGENRPQELERKYEIFEDVKFHMIGHLQTNKIKNIIGKAELVHSLDRLSLAKELDRKSRENGIITDVLIQVNVSEEESKFGLKSKEVLPFIEKILEYDSIKVRGLMTMAPFTEDEKIIRNTFRGLYNLKEDINSRSYKDICMDFLSMGMTNDYEIAIEEGANMVRVGSAIFGKRNY